MKTAICFDSSIKRDEATILIELVLNLFPESEIYTIVHKPGGILGRIESRSIVSSFLSHKVKENFSFDKYFWILPSAIKGMPFHQSIEKVIVLSRGYIHGLNFPSHLESYLYLLDWDLIDQKKLGWQKLFDSYVNQWREKALCRYRKIAVSSEHLKTSIGLPNAEVITPTFKTEDYSFVKDEDHNFLFTHHLILTHGYQHSELGKILSFLSSKGEKVILIGPDQHLSSLKMSYPSVEFVGDHCEATIAYYSHQAKTVWDGSSTFFPSRALGALCCGRPATVRDNSINREYLKKGVYFLKNVEDGQLEFLFSEISRTYLSHDRRELRRIGLKWNERLFKSRMCHFLNS